MYCSRHIFRHVLRIAATRAAGSANRIIHPSSHTSPTGKRAHNANNTNALNCSMPTQRKTSRHELTPIEWAYLVGRYDAGESFGQSSHETGIPKTTIIDTVHSATERGNTNSLPRTHPRATDTRTDRRLNATIYNRITPNPHNPTSLFLHRQTPHPTPKTPTIAPPCAGSATNPFATKNTVTIQNITGFTVLVR
jgi:hypothetical protein